MYGNRVHQAVMAAGEKHTGISIHFVNENYDEGEIILQDQFNILPDDTAESIADRIHVLEHKHYPLVIETLLKDS